MKPIGLFLLGLMLIPLHPVPASESDTDRLHKALAGLDADIRRDTEALVALRAEIAAARIPLAEQLAELQAEAAALRADADRLARLRQQGERDQARMLASAAAAQESFRYAETLVTEYARSLDTRVGAAEASALLHALPPLRDALMEADPASFASEVEALLALAVQWNEARLGGHVFAGAALDDHGVAHAGHFAAAGPMVYFLADDKQLAGMAIPRMGSIEPGVHPLGHDVEGLLERLLQGDAVVVPADVSGGDAIRLVQSRVNIVARLRKGGFVMIPLLLTGALALLLAIWKAAALWRLHQAVGADIGDISLLLQQGDVARARERNAAIKAPLADIVQEAIVHRHVPREHLEEILHEHVVNVLPQAERHLGTLSVLGGVAPLLGLLGTVTGMIHTFQLVTLFGSGDARMLSGGISEALITTETGLIIAVPVLLVQAFLARGARSVVATLERQALTLVNHIHVRGRV